MQASFSGSCFPHWPDRMFSHQSLILVLGRTDGELAVLPFTLVRVARRSPVGFPSGREGGSLGPKMHPYFPS